MKHEYIAQVKKLLILSRDQKNKVERDLNEIFDSAAEHGETENQVIERLGSPEVFAKEIACNFDSKRKGNKRRRATVPLIWCMGALSLISIILSTLLRQSRFPDNAIGGADAMTQITVQSALPSLPTILLLVGIVLAVAAILLTFVHVCRVRRTR